MSCKVEEAMEKLEQLVSYLDIKTASVSKKEIAAYNANKKVVQRILRNVEKIAALKQDKEKETTKKYTVNPKENVNTASWTKAINNENSNKVQSYGERHEAVLPWETDEEYVVRKQNIPVAVKELQENKKPDTTSSRAPIYRKIGVVTLPNKEILNIVSVPSSILTKSNGVVIAAKFDRESKTVYLNEDKEVWKKYFENKNWTKPREQKDGSFAKAIRESAFATQKEMRDFIIQHEVAHYTLGAKKVGETIGEYESRVNEEAGRVLGLNLYNETSNNVIADGERPEDVLPWETDEEYIVRKQNMSAELVERLQTNKATTNTTNDIMSNIMNCEG